MSHYGISKRLKSLTALALVLVLLCCFTSCSRAPGADSTELCSCTFVYFTELKRLNVGFQQAMLDSFRQAAENLDKCIRSHDEYFDDYPDAKAGFQLMVQLPTILEQNLSPSEDGRFDLRQLPDGWYYCILDLWRYVYQGVYGAQHGTKEVNDAQLLKWLADDSFSNGSSPFHWWLDSYLSGSAFHVQWPEPVEWQRD